MDSNKGKLELLIKVLTYLDTRVDDESEGVIMRDVVILKNITKSSSCKYFNN
jgi:hypothetical protein